MTTTAIQHVTSGDIARELGEQVASVNYAIVRARIQPVGRAGIIRLFDRSAVDRVRDELAGIEGRREARAAHA